MTPNDINSMPAGRDMDRLVSDMVFGDLDKVDEREYHLMIPSGATLPYYSTSMQEAWRVVERMWDTRLAYFHIGYCESLYLVQFIIAGVVYRETSKSAPLAICKAALKAILAEKEKR